MLLCFYSFIFPGLSNFESSKFIFSDIFSFNLLLIIEIFVGTIALPIFFPIPHTHKPIISCLVCFKLQQGYTFYIMGIH